MRKTLVFDVNETLLDLSVLKLHFDKIFGNENVLHEWFNQCIHNAMLSVILETNLNFKDVGRHSLTMIGDKYNINIKNEDRDLLVQDMTRLPPHYDVVDSMNLLKKNNFRLIALSNNSSDTLLKQLKNAQLDFYFDEIISVEIASTLKPSHKVYDAAASFLNEENKNLTMIACHSWDIAAAMKVGYKGALVKRQGMPENPLFQEPDFIENNLNDLAKKIVESKDNR